MSGYILTPTKRVMLYFFDKTAASYLVRLRYTLPIVINQDLKPSATYS
jgi:hypothetical protein